MTSVDASTEASSRPPRVRVPGVFTVIAVGFIAFVAGFAVAALIGDNVGTQPEDPALATAQALGLAIPEAQYAAFADGEITFDEVERAADDFRACAEASGVAGFTLRVSENSMEMTFLDPDDWFDVQVCSVRHFDATHRVFQSSGIAIDEITPFRRDF